MADYEAKFKETLLALKQEEITGGVFGDIDIEEHREWIERVCEEEEITPSSPLWGQTQENVLSSFIASGFEAVVVAAKAELFGEEWLGRRIDLDFIRQLDKLRETNDFQLCGEAGEYHTFVIDGPLFNQRIEILETNKVLKEGHWFLEIVKYALKPK